MMWCGLLAFTNTCLLTIVSSSSTRQQELLNKWTQFKVQHGKFYDTALEEHNRFLIWEDNVAYIDRHNEEYDMGKQGYFLRVNEFADLRHDEFVRRMNGYRARKSITAKPDAVLDSPRDFQPPSSVDWRQHGYVTRVKNQGRCGGCWAFSTTGALEGQSFKKTKKLVSLSEQQLIDCDKNDLGCRGGEMDPGFLFVKHNGGIASEHDYPYRGKDGTCRKIARVAANCSGYVDVKRGEANLLSAVASTGPISVAIDASHRSFHFFSGGIYDEPKCSSTQLDHAVLLVGYGADGDSPYWLVKNSWGATWGSRGYVKMVRNKNNQCGIASQPSFPLV